MNPAPRALAWLNVILMTLFLAAFLVGVNLVSHARFSRVDMTTDKVWEISPQSRQVVRSVQKPISIYLNFTESPEVQDKSLQMAWNRTHQLLTEINNQNSQIFLYSLTELSPPPGYNELVKQISRPEYNTIYFLTRDLEDKPVVRSLGVREIYEGNPQTGDILDYIGEAKIVTMLSQLITDKKTKIYHTVGHREVQPSQSDAKGLSVVTSRITGMENAEFKPLDLARDKAVPDDADLVFIVEPTVDFSTIETEALEKYWKRGGRFFVALHPLIADPLVELKRSLETFGVRYNRDVVVDTRRENRNPGFLTVRAFMQHPVNQGMYNSGYLIPFASTVDPVLIKKDAQAKVLFISSPESYAETDLPPKEDSKHNVGERVGNLPLAAVAEEAAAVGRPARIIAWGSSMALNNQFNITGGAPNERTVGYVLNNFRWLLEREMLIAAPSESRKLKMRPFQPGADGLSVMWWVSIVVIPLVGVVLGGVTWHFRRK